MKTEKISVNELIRGWHSVARMRREIDLIIDALLGRLRKLPDIRTVLARGRVIREADLQWSITIVDLERPKIVVECSANKKGVIFSSAYRHLADDISLANVETVYDGLQALIDALFDEFPRLREEADRIVCVAEKFASAEFS